MEKNFVIAPGYSLPPYWMRNIPIIKGELDKSTEQSAFSGIIQQHKLTFKVDGLQDFTFPIDPLISLSFGNVIARRTVAKGKLRGTVKERWTEDDVEISINGKFISTDGEFPLQVDLLRQYVQQHKSIKVECTLLNDRGIDMIAIEGYNLPFTKGAENQDFEIKAYSDDIVELLIEQ